MNIDESLIGKIVTEIRMDPDKDAIAFKIDGCWIIFSCLGTCCASMWIEDVLHPSFIIGSEIRYVSCKEIKQKDDDYEVLDIWGYQIGTAKGVCDIELRVSHNGFYGGELVYHPHSDFQNTFWSPIDEWKILASM